MELEKAESIIYELKEHYLDVPKWVAEAREYHKTMKALVYGDKFKDLLLKIEHIESDKKAEARRKYSRPIKDINKKILNPVGFVYSATGGSKDYEINNPEEKKRFINEISNLKGGLSLSRWLEINWSKDLYNVDPSGLMMLEWKDQKAYLTYKSIDTIRYYKAEGCNVKYVIFEPKKTNDGNIWRIVTDEYDCFVSQKGSEFSIIESMSFDNPFGKCPARICSEITQFGKEYRLAFIDAIIETEQELLRDRSILSIYKFQNGFATHYRPKIICPSCHGTKKNGLEKCPDCDGKGYILDKDVTDEIIIPIDLTAENPVQLPTNFAGFISPPLDIWNQYVDEAKRLTVEGFEATWGTTESEVKDMTAMGAYLNTLPMINKLYALSDVAQAHEIAFTEMLAVFHQVKPKDSDETISRINYGRNYIIQPAEYQLTEYQKSFTNKQNTVILDSQLTEYLTSKYRHNPEQLRQELLKKKLEPYIYFDAMTVRDVFGTEEAQKKLLFNEWWSTLTIIDLNKTYEALVTMRDAYFTERVKPIVAQQPNIKTDAQSL